MIREECEICAGSKHRQATFCKRCKRLLDRVDTRRKANKNARALALKQAWDGEGFRCYYTGVRLKDTGHDHPLYLTFDHRIPRNEDGMVVAAYFVNDMKSDLSETEFKAVIRELASRFNGGAFDQDVLTFEHWKRSKSK